MPGEPDLEGDSQKKPRTSLGVLNLTCSVSGVTSVQSIKPLTTYYVLVLTKIPSFCSARHYQFLFLVVWCVPLTVNWVMIIKQYPTLQVHWLGNLDPFKIQGYQDRDGYRGQDSRFGDHRMLKGGCCWGFGNGTMTHLSPAALCYRHCLLPCIRHSSFLGYSQSRTSFLRQGQSLDLV